MTDQKKFLSLKASLSSKIGQIRDQQGFTKNLDDIQLCIDHICFGHIPKDKVKGLLKPTKKLHYSLQLYLWRSGFCHRPIKERFPNIFHDYALFEEDRKMLNTPIDLTDIIAVNVPEACVTASYKPKRIKTFDEDRLDGDAISSRFRNKANAIVKSRPGIKRVNKDLEFHIKLKKKYSTEEDLNDDLYRIFSCWYRKKVESHEHHVSLHNRFMNVLQRYSQIRENKAIRGYFLSKEALMKYIDLRRTDCSQVPKRFMKITKLLSHIKENKWIKNDSVVEAFVTKATVPSSQEDSGVYRRVGDCCIYTASRQVFKWLSLIFEDLRKRGYLRHEDVPVTRKKIVGPIYLCDPITNYHHSKMWHDKSLMLPFRKRTDKFYRGLRNILLADIHETYVRLNYDELDFFDYINSENKKIKKMVSSSEFKEFVRRFHEPRIGLPQLKTEFLKMLGKDDKINSFLDEEEKAALERASLVNPLVDYMLESLTVSKAVEYQLRLTSSTKIVNYRDFPSDLKDQILTLRARKHGIISKLKNVKLRSKKVFSEEEWNKVVVSVLTKELPYKMDINVALEEIKDSLNF